MKQLLVLSGKGGTGKTTIATAFIKLAQAKAYADCDVDAPNLHLIMQQSTDAIQSDYYGLPKAEINLIRCIQCNLCRQACRFDAISIRDDDFGYVVNYYACEGCGVCEAICPMKAVSLNPAIAGELLLYKDEAVFSTAKLSMGSGTNGLLVTEVKKQLLSAAKATELAVIDGSPGIGCPVIASLSGVDMVLIVVEPSISGISDMERIVKTAGKFNVDTVVCINKYDTNFENTEKIEQYCKKHKLHIVGKVPYDANAVKAINNGQSIVDIDCVSGNAVKECFNETIKILI
jgi:MinD superfamily P-loop ATPase